VGDDEVRIDQSTVSFPDPLQVVGIRPEFRFERKPVFDRIGMNTAIPGAWLDRPDERTGRS